MSHSLLHFDAALNAETDFRLDPTSDNVATPSLAYQTMAAKWTVLNDLLGGTPRMREAGRTYLPQWEKETSDLWHMRRELAVLYNGFRNAVRRYVSLPFSRPVVLKNDDVGFPERLRPLENDSDMAGQDLTQFLRNVFASAVVYGMSHVLVDFSAVSPQLTQGEERRSGARARFVHILPTQLLYWFPETPPLQQVHILEFVREVEPGKSYKQRTVPQIRVYTDKSWQLFRQVRDKDEGMRWTPVTDEQQHSFGRVPLETFYVNRTGFLTADPPLEDLAELNVAHWQSNADQRSILRFARVPFLFGSGFPQELVKQGVQLSAGKGTFASNDKANLRWVEHSGAAIESGRRDLQDLREQMAALGDQPLRERSGDITATGRAIDESRSQTDVHAWVESLKGTARDLFSMAAEWTGEVIPEDFAVEIYNNFSLLLRSDKDMAILDRARERRDIQRITWLRESQRRGILSKDVDVNEEDEAIENAQPDLPIFGREEQEDDETDENNEQTTPRAVLTER